MVGKMIVGCIHGGTMALLLVWGRVVAGLCGG